MDRTAPAFFKQGPSALVRLVGFALAALALLAVDAKLGALQLIRSGVAVTLYPLQRAMLVPRNMLREGSGYFDTVNQLQAENDRLRRTQVELAGQVQDRKFIAAENEKLRALQQAGTRLTPPTVLTEVLFEARDPFIRRVLIDRGKIHGVLDGQPVVDEKGVVGQVTRAYVASSEVTLLTDINQAIAVQVVRNGIRSVAYGGEDPGMLALRFMPANADIREGDELVTSGIDGVFPSGLAVARVTKVDRGATAGFARILCAPIGGTQQNKHLLVLKVEMPKDLPPPPSFETEGTKKGKSRKGGSGQGALRDVVSPTQPASAVPSAQPAVTASQVTPKPSASSVPNNAAGVPK